MGESDLLTSLIGPTLNELNTYSVLLRLCLSLLFSAIVGWERSANRHSAGMRTFIIVSLGSTMAALMDVYLSKNFPIISAATLIGIAFISTNSVLFNSKGQIKGLTTSVALWCVSIEGLVIGGGFYTLYIIGSLIMFLCLKSLPASERYLKDRSNHFEISLELSEKYKLQDFMATLRQLGIKIDDLESNPAYLNSGLSVFTLALTIKKDELRKYKTHKDIIDALSTLDYVNYIEEI